ncbi:flavodoxin-dependent (E)-4-hydroxy-3-methylbut-2-enyl-diphosphate synthase [Petrimonas sp.]|uniref:flavodoxin-dependent (E)-4-hydroxy-3-methylbut-2-enyl-diphosphate synthase n=1 Tax=Petrimonas sp. TaxID=2023866 RepID=UPI00331AFF7D
MDYFNYHRRPTIDVHIGNITMGGNHPVVVQTMTNTNTLDTEGSVAQCERIMKKPMLSVVMPACRTAPSFPCTKRDSRISCSTRTES